MIHTIPYKIYTTALGLQNQFISDWAFRLALEREQSFLAQSEYTPLEKINAEKLRQVRNLLAYSYERVRLYRLLFDQKGVLPSDIRTEDDMLMVPTTSKKLFLRYPREEIIATRVSSSRIARGTTSGSTGEPFRYFRDLQFRPLGKANLYRAWRWAGVDPNASTVHCSAPHAQGNTPNTVFLHPHFIHQRKKEYIQKIRISGAKIIRGFPLTNFELGKMLVEEGCDDLTFTHAFFVGHVLLNGIRNFFRERFGCEIYNYYASEETGALATECEFHLGLHIHEESFLIEIVDDQGKPTPEGKLGKIVITSLLNEVMPIIRYDIGDIGMLVPGRCPCARTSRRLLVQGRKEDLFLGTRGEIIYPGILRDILDEYFFAFHRYQMIQFDLQKFLLRFVPTKQFTAAVDKRMIEQLRTCLAPGTEVILQPVEHILPLPSGKFQYFISDFWRMQYPQDFFRDELSG